MSRGPNNTDWTKAEIIEIPVFVPRCPKCGGDEFKRVRGENNGDGSSTQRAFCKSCNKPVLLVRDERLLPFDGNTY